MRPDEPLDARALQLRAARVLTGLPPAAVELARRGVDRRGARTG